MRLKFLGVRQCAGIEITIIVIITLVAARRGIYVPVESFELPVRLEMVCSGEEVVNVQDFENILQELGREKSSVVGDEFLRSLVVEEQFIK